MRIILFLVLFIVSVPTWAAPDFRLPDMQGKYHSPQQWRGKVVLLNFWATWCTPCKKEIPLLNRVQQDYGDDVLVVGIAIDNRNAVSEFQQRIPLRYLNLIGGQQAVELVQQYGNTAGALPFSVFINKQGKIVQQASGMLNRRFIDQQLEKLL